MSYHFYYPSLIKVLIKECLRSVAFLQSPWRSERAIQNDSVMFINIPGVSQVQYYGKLNLRIKWVLVHQTLTQTFYSSRPSHVESSGWFPTTRRIVTFDSTKNWTELTKLLMWAFYIDLFQSLLGKMFLWNILVTKGTVVSRYFLIRSIYQRQRKKHLMVIDATATIWLSLICVSSDLTVALICIVRIHKNS